LWDFVGEPPGWVGKTSLEKATGFNRKNPDILKEKRAFRGFLVVFFFNFNKDFIKIVYSKYIKKHRNLYF
jgi:hypothetical protein